MAHPLNTGCILARRALPARRVTRLDATPDFHHGLLGDKRVGGARAESLSGAFLRVRLQRFSQRRSAGAVAPSLRTLAQAESCALEPNGKAL